MNKSVCIPFVCIYIVLDSGTIDVILVSSDQSSLGTYTSRYIILQLTCILCRSSIAFALLSVHPPSPLMYIAHSKLSCILCTFSCAYTFSSSQHCFQRRQKTSGKAACSVCQDSAVVWSGVFYLLNWPGICSSTKSSFLELAFQPLFKAKVHPN